MRAERPKEARRQAVGDREIAQTVEKEVLKLIVSGVPRMSPLQRRAGVVGQGDVPAAPS
jgi:hypothetical protein